MRFYLISGNSCFGFGGQKKSRRRWSVRGSDESDIRHRFCSHSRRPAPSGLRLFSSLLLGLQLRLAARRTRHSASFQPARSQSDSPNRAVCRCWNASGAGSHSEDVGVARTTVGLRGRVFTATRERLRARSCPSPKPAHRVVSASLFCIPTRA